MSYSDGEAVVLSHGIEVGGAHVTGGSLGTVVHRARSHADSSVYMVNWGEFGSFHVNENEIEPATLQYGDPVQSPSHYDLPGGLKVIDIVRDESFLRGNIIKYVLRAPHKQNELEDMKKAAEYLKWEIERLENES